jgi:hypothetical protein
MSADYSKNTGKTAQFMHIAGFSLFAPFVEPEVRIEPPRFDSKNLGVESRFPKPGTGT